MSLEKSVKRTLLGVMAAGAALEPQIYNQYTEPLVTSTLRTIVNFEVIPQLGALGTAPVLVGALAGLWYFYRQRQGWS